MALLATFAIGANAQEKVDNKPVFTTVKEIPITSIKDQNRSGTCWAYSTLSYFEAEILKATGKTALVVCYISRAIATLAIEASISMVILSCTW